MNKLASINLAIMEVNKQAMIAGLLGGAARLGRVGLNAAKYSTAKVSSGLKTLSGASQRAGANIVKSMPPAIGGPKPIPGAATAALGAQKPGLLGRVAKNPYAIIASIAAPMVPGSSPPIP